MREPGSIIASLAGIRGEHNIKIKGTSQAFCLSEGRVKVWLVIQLDENII